MFHFHNFDKKLLVSHNHILFSNTLLEISVKLLKASMFIILFEKLLLFCLFVV